MATAIPPYKIQPYYGYSPINYNPTWQEGLRMSGEDFRAYNNSINNTNAKPPQESGFPDIQKLLGTPISLPPIQKQDTTGIRPETQAMLDAITRAAESRAKSTMLKRGMEGSTTEGFGVAKAIAEAQAPIYAQNLQTQTQINLAQIQAEAERGNLQAQLELNRIMSLAGFTSDEIASLRGMNDAEKNRIIQMRLGEMGVTQAGMTSAAMERSASKQANASLWSSVIQGGTTAAIVAPF